MTELSALTKSGRPPSQLRQDRLGRILAAAVDVFAAKGFDGTTTSDIALAAKLPKANVHYYFGTKENIYRTVLGQILEFWLGEADHWLAPGRPAREALTGYIQAKLALSRQRPEASRIYAGELLRGAPHIRHHLHGALRARVAAFSTVIEGWIAAGEVKPVDPAHLLFCLWAMTQTYADFAVQIGAVLDKTELGETEFAAASIMITNMVLDGVTNDAARGGTS